MNPGELNKIITIQSRASTTDAFGGTIYTWSTFATVWAKVSPLKGREMIAAQAAQSEVTTRIKTRWISGVTTGMRIVYDGQNFDIISAIDPNEAHEELQIMAKTGTSEG
jgi:SPP1 family predicted phage head-tail adaptor